MPRTIRLKAADLPADAEAKFREVELPDGTAHVLCTEPSGGGSGGTVTEEDITIYCREFKLSAKLRTRTVGEGEEAVSTLIDIKPVSKAPYSPSDRRLLLQIVGDTESATLDLDKGYLKE